MKLKEPTTAPAIGSTGIHSERGTYTVLDIVGFAVVVRYADSETAEEIARLPKELAG